MFTIVKTSDKIKELDLFKLPAQALPVLFELCPGSDHYRTISKKDIRPPVLISGTFRGTEPERSGLYVMLEVITIEPRAILSALAAECAVLEFKM